MDNQNSQQPFFQSQDRRNEPRPGEAKKGSLFSKEIKGPSLVFNQVSNEMNNLSRRVRIIEERYSNLRNKSQVTEQNMLMNNKRLTSSMTMLTSDINELKREVKEIKDTVKLIIKELNETVKKEEVSTLKKYIDLWEPVNFVTREGVEKIIKKFIEESSEEKE